MLILLIAELPNNIDSRITIANIHYLSYRAFGVVLWEMFTMGHVPYPGKSNGEVMKYVKGGQRLDKPPLCPHQM